MEGVDRRVKNIAREVYLSRCYGGITKRQTDEDETLTYSMLCPAGRFSKCVCFNLHPLGRRGESY